MNRRGVCRNQGVELAETIGEHAPVETRGQLVFIGIDIVDIADVAVIDLLVVVVFYLHHLVAGREGPAGRLATRC